MVTGGCGKTFGSVRGVVEERNFLRDIVVGAAARDLVW